MRLDSHQHFLKYESKRQPWITEEMKVINEKFSFQEDLYPIDGADQNRRCNKPVQADCRKATPEKLPFCVIWR